MSIGPKEFMEAIPNSKVNVGYLNSAFFAPWDVFKRDFDDMLVEAGDQHAD